mgnify:CR=1 FL=1
MTIGIIPSLSIHFELHQIPAKREQKKRPAMQNEPQKAISWVFFIVSCSLVNTDGLEIYTHWINHFSLAGMTHSVW